MVASADDIEGAALDLISAHGPEPERSLRSRNRAALPQGPAETRFARTRVDAEVRLGLSSGGMDHSSVFGTDRLLQMLNLCTSVDGCMDVANWFQSWGGAARFLFTVSSSDLIEIVRGNRRNRKNRKIQRPTEEKTEESTNRKKRLESTERTGVYLDRGHDEEQRAPLFSTWQISTDFSVPIHQIPRRRINRTADFRARSCRLWENQNWYVLTMFL